MPVFFRRAPSRLRPLVTIAILSAIHGCRAAQAILSSVFRCPSRSTFDTEKFAMADAREYGTQELFSARYLVESEEDIAPAVGEPSQRVRASRSGLEQAIRCLTMLVPILLIAAAGGLYW